MAILKDGVWRKQHQNTNASPASPKLSFFPHPHSHALMALEQERAALPSSDVPHDDAVVGGSREE